MEPDVNKFFSVDARTIMQLGRDSIKEFTTALVELVKNCYDADADIVEIEIIIKEEGEYIRISDNGFGMSESIIDHNWLRIGFSEKKLKKRSQKNRRKTGEKGIGRIAADRLGRKLTLLSVSEGDIAQGLEVNWDLFDVDGTEISRVPLKIINNPSPKLPNNSKHGTEIIIKNLRQKWTVSHLEKLYNELTTLTPPFTDDEKFNIYINSNLDSKYKNIRVHSTFIDAAEIELRVDYDGEQKKLTYYIENRRFPGKEYIKEIDVNRLISSNIANKDGKLSCGPFQIRLWFFLRDASVLDRTNYNKLAEFREVLDQNLGVKIYRDDIAVKPYGYPESEYGDWLGLALRKAQNPAGVGRDSYSITPNQLVGAVFIERDTNEKVLDSAGREGLIENEEFDELKNIVLGAIQVLESHRVEINKEITGSVQAEGKTQSNKKMPKLQMLDEINKGLSSAQSLIDQAKNSIGESGNITIIQSLKASQDKIILVEKDINETIVEMLNEKRTLNGLATLGITTAVFGHETESAISVLKQAASNSLEHLSLDPPNYEKAKKEIAKVKKYSNQVGSWGDFALSRVSTEKRTNPKPQKIHEVIHDVIGEIKPMIEGADITVESQIIDKVVSRLYLLDIEAILYNLITNAYQACLQVNTERKIIISLTRVDKDNIPGYCILVEDNGPGIAPEFINRIWEPLFSTKIGSKKKKTNGTGLGLTIVESIVNELDGTVNAENSRNYKGAKFTVWLPKIV